MATGDHPPLESERIIEALDRHGVQYLLVGGLAAMLHGAQRPTLDLDLLPRSDAEHLERLAAALVDLGAFLRVGGLTDDEARALPTIIDGPSLRGMEISTWRTDAGDVDVLRHLRNEAGGALPSRIWSTGRSPSRFSRSTFSSRAWRTSSRRSGSPPATRTERRSPSWSSCSLTSRRSYAAIGQDCSTIRVGLCRKSPLRHQRSHTSGGT